jgi:MoxR-like ATPase
MEIIQSEQELPKFTEVQIAAERIRKEIHKVIVGQDEMITLILAGLFTGGHVLIEGVPGIAKTMTVNLLAKALDLNFKRIQFTPDLMPADVTGTSVYNVQSASFEFKPGPIFSNIVLIDEINRSPAKTQAALFEVMEELQVTVDGRSHPMSKPFMVLATQNPIEQEGTYKLPEAQQDRFLFRIKIDYPSYSEELEIIKRFEGDFAQSSIKEVQSVLSFLELEACMKAIQSVFIKEELIEFIARIIDKTRRTSDLFLGASPRASLAIVKTSKALAAMQGRDYVSPDDIVYSLYPVLNHRLILSAEKEMDGFEVKEVLDELIKQVEVPR